MAASPDGATPPAAGRSGTPTPGGPATWRRYPVKTGTAFVTDLAGRASGVTMRVYVWLPPQYSDPAYAGKRFPVVMTYPGGAGASGAVWLTHGAPEAVVAGTKAGGTPFVLVQPQMQLTEALDTECTDLPGQPKVGTFLEDDVTRLVKASFAVDPDRSAWATTGVSSGAYCAARVAMHRPDLFGAAAPIDGYFTIDSNVRSGRTAAAEATSPLTIAAKNPPDLRIHTWYGTGHNNGQITKKESARLAAAVRPPTVFSQSEIPGGAHSWTTYRTLLPRLFTWLSGTVAKVQ